MRWQDEYGDIEDRRLKEKGVAFQGEDEDMVCLQ